MPTKKKKNQKETAFPENQVMMMLESMQGGIEIIAEGQQGLREDLNEFKIETRNNFKRVDQRFDKINQELKSFKIETRNNFKQNDKKFKQIDKRFEQVDQNFERVFNSLDEIKQEVKDIRKELDQMKNQPVIRREEFEILVKRVERVEMSMDR